MDTHTQHDPNNPNNFKPSDEDLQIQRDENIISLLDSLADKYIGDTPSEYLSSKQDLTDVDDLFDDLQDNGYFNEEVIYYSSAIRYLKENDPSLTESLDSTMQEDLISYNDADELFNDLQDNGYFNEEVIYYSTAIRYLKDNDPSLCESLEIATEYGYTTENLNSELLATLHASQKKENTFHEDIAPELENLFNN